MAQLGGPIDENESVVKERVGSFVNPVAKDTRCDINSPLRGLSIPLYYADCWEQDQPKRLNAAANQIDDGHASIDPLWWSRISHGENWYVSYLLMLPVSRTVFRPRIEPTIPPRSLLNARPRP